MQPSSQCSTGVAGRSMNVPDMAKVLNHLRKDSVVKVSSSVSSAATGTPCGNLPLLLVSTARCCHMWAFCSYRFGMSRESCGDLQMSLSSSFFTVFHTPCDLLFAAARILLSTLHVSLAAETLLVSPLQQQAPPDAICHCCLSALQFVVIFSSRKLIVNTSCLTGCRFTKLSTTDMPLVLFVQLPHLEHADSIAAACRLCMMPRAKKSGLAFIASRQR